MQITPDYSRHVSKVMPCTLLYFKAKNETTAVIINFCFARGAIMWKIVVLCATLSLAAAQKATFENYKVYRIMPTTEAQVGTLRQLEEIPDGFSFWQEPNSMGKSVDLMVAPHKQPEFHEIMTQIGVSYNTHIDNVQALIQDVKPAASRSTSFDFYDYHTLDNIYKNLDDLAEQYPDKVQVVVGGKTYEGRPINGVKISFKVNNPGVFIEGGIHGREWISPATVMYIIHQLLSSTDANVRSMAESHDWYIFPVFNPDGYVYTHTKNRLWRKTRKPNWRCRGSDPNRNWHYEWNMGGANSDPCSETYPGTEPFSEEETKTMSEYIESISDKFYAYISLHSYGQCLMFPYGYTSKLLDNYEDSYVIAEKAIKALKQRHRTRYEKPGNIAQTFYIATGSTVDYIKGKYRKPIVYVYQLRDGGHYGFLLPPDQIIPTGEETLDSFVAMFKEAKVLGYPKKI